MKLIIHYIYTKSAIINKVMMKSGIYEVNIS